MFNRVITVRVDFPALDALVAYLQAQGDQQKQIDALAAQVQDLTAALHKTQTGLARAVETQEK